MHRLLPFAALVLLAAPLPAQSAGAASSQKAAKSITTDDVARRIRVIADDSMLGRDTPSRGLELTAQYVADQFKKFGLKPGGDNGSWFQRYPLPGHRIDFARSRLVFAAPGAEAAAAFTSAAYLARALVPEQLTSAGAVLVAGRHTAESAQQADVSDKVVLYVAPAGVDPAVRQAVLSALAEKSKGLVLVDQDSAGFTKRLAAALQKPAVGTGSSWAAYIWPGTLQKALAAGGLDLAQARADTTPVVRQLPQLTVRPEMTIGDIATAPNTVGILEGSDPTLKNEYILFSAHMDHVGTGGNAADYIFNGADDDASGTVGVVELAEAFSQPGARPKRSIIFLTVSGEEKGLWGSEHFATHPPVPLKQVVADFNIDMIGRNWKDTIVAIGKEHSDLGATLNRVNAAHPELGMTAIDDIWPTENFYSRSDHYNFARRGVPILFFFNGVHKDYHQLSDSPDKIDAEKEARILRLIYYVGQDVANAPERPKWNEASYKQIVTGE